VDEVTTWTVRTETDGVEGAARLGFVLGVARQTPQLVVAVRELTLLPVFARAILLERPTQLCLVAGGVDLRARLLLQNLELLAPFPIFAVRAVTKLVFLVHYGGVGAAIHYRVFFQVVVGACWVLVAVGHRIHVTGRVSTEKSRGVGAVVGARRCDGSSHCFLVQHTVDVNGVHVESLFLLVKHVDVVECGQDGCRHLSFGTVLS